MAAILTLGASLAILGYLVVDELLFRLRPVLRRRGIALLPEFRRLDWRAYLPLPIAVILAWRFAAPLISTYILVVGVLITLYLARRARAGERVQLDRQVAQLVTAFHSIYKLRPSVFSALEQACKKVDQPLRDHVALAVQAFYITASPERAFNELEERVNNPYLTQFLYILRRSEAARREAVVSALEGLMERLRAHEEMRTQFEVNLAVITGQTLFIQVISLIIIFFIAFTGLREAYTSSWARQLFFILVASVGVATSYYIDRRAISLKERIL
ncbi:MAG TPA: hypothetical protein EYP55_05320 [Anaerolineae bacterium]|nr:hypothetical protein [Anaerolineae bacterium]